MAHKQVEIALRLRSAIPADSIYSVDGNKLSTNVADITFGMILKCDSLYIMIPDQCHVSCKKLRYFLNILKIFQKTYEKIAK